MEDVKLIKPTKEKYDILLIYSDMLQYISYKKRNKKNRRRKYPRKLADYLHFYNSQISAFYNEIL